MRFICEALPLIKCKAQQCYKEIKLQNKGFFKKPLFLLGFFSFVLLSIPCFDINFIFNKNIEKGNNFFNKDSEYFLVQDEPSAFLTQKEQFGFVDFNIIQKNSLKAIYSLNNVSFQTLTSLSSKNDNELSNEDNSFFNDSKEIIEYIVEKGDSFSSISEKFGISIETILWANNLSKKSALKTGQKLVILPISGVLHYVKNGDTLNSIAKNYKANISEIIAFNELSSEGNIYIGDILIIPNGIMPITSIPPVAPSVQQTPLASSYFIVPVSLPYIISQGIHWYNAIDFTHLGGACGKPVFAAAGGQVLKISYGWNMGAGNYLKILHPNGVITMYGHLQTILVKEGDNVFQGQIIALIGGQPGTPGAGKSTGCHLHFSVQGAKNPFAK